MMPLHWVPGDRCYVRGANAVGHILKAEPDAIMVRLLTGLILSARPELVELPPRAPEMATDEG